MKVKKCVVIGLGHFGYQLSVQLSEMGVEVISIDKNEKNVRALKDRVALSVQLDSTDIDSLDEIGVGEYDCAVVAIGEDFADSLLTISNLQELKVKKIISRVVNPAHEKILRKMDIEEIILPESVAAQKLAKTISMEGVVESFEVSKDYSIIEAKAPEWTISKKVQELQMRELFNIHLVTIIKIEEEKSLLALSKSRKICVQGVPSAETEIKEDDILLVFGKAKDIKKFLKN